MFPNAISCGEISMARVAIAACDGLVGIAPLHADAGLRDPFALLEVAKVNPVGRQLDRGQRLLFQPRAQVLWQLLTGEGDFRTRDLKLGLIQSIKLGDAAILKRALDDLQRLFARRCRVRRRNRSAIRNQRQTAATT